MTPYRLDQLDLDRSLRDQAASMQRPQAHLRHLIETSGRLELIFCPRGRHVAGLFAPTFG
jgi:hypothetical protein